MNQKQWDAQPLYRKSEKVLIDVANKGANKLAAQCKIEAPVYQGPPRKSGRMPGTLRKDIHVKKLVKWSQVIAPMPGAFVEFGVGEVGNKRTTPNPFMARAFDKVFPGIVKMTQGRV